MTVLTGSTADAPATENPSLESAPVASATVAAAPLDDASVANWLARHPLFFHQHQELLLELSIPHESGRAISLLERQVAVFRERQHTLQDQIHEFISNARNNDNLFEKTRLAVLDLLRCRTLSQLLKLVREKLPTDFDASAATLLFVAEHAPLADASCPWLHTSDVRTALGDLFARQRTYCGALNDAQQKLLFAGAQPPVVSAAIVPLHLPEGTPIRRDYGLPLLLIGSTEGQHFNSSLDTLFLDFIGEVLAVHLQNLPCV